MATARFRLVSGLVDLAHAADANPDGDFVRAEARAWSGGHSRVIIWRLRVLEMRARHYEKSGGRSVPRAVERDERVVGDE